jgi:hypothetical protein
MGRGRLEHCPEYLKKEMEQINCSQPWQASLEHCITKAAELVTTAIHPPAVPIPFHTLLIIAIQTAAQSPEW